MSDSSDRLVKGFLVALVLGAGLLGIRGLRRPPTKGPQPLPGSVALFRPPDAGAVEAGDLPAGDLRAPQALVQIAVYLRKKPAKPASALWRSFAASRAFVVSDQPPDAGLSKPTVLLREPPIEELAPPKMDSLAYFAVGLSAEDQLALSRTKYVIALAAVLPHGDARARYGELLHAAEELAAATNGYLWDESTRQAFSQEAWRERYADWVDGSPDVERHIALHAYRDGELLRLVTLGMLKFGLPDVEVNEVTGHSSQAMGKLVSLLCQTLLEKQTIEHAGLMELSIDDVKVPSIRKALQGVVLKNGTGKLRVALSIGHPRSGDADNRMIEIVFPGAVGDVQQRQAAALAQLFGSQDSLVQAAADDQELQAARAHAKVQLMKLKPRFAKGVPEKESLLVKGPFRSAEGKTEWMWVEVTKWEGKTLHGILQNDAFDIPELRMGMRVKVEEDSVFDYLFQRSDGTREGGETSVILEKRAPK